MHQKQKASKQTQQKTRNTYKNTRKQIKTHKHKQYNQNNKRVLKARN